MKTYDDDDKNKKVKRQTLRRQFECICMDKSKTISEYFDKTQEIVNALRACKDTITDQQVVNKILKTLPQRFDHVVVTIEETKDSKEMELEVLQHSLEAHEHIIHEKRHNLEQALQARAF